MDENLYKIIKCTLKSFLAVAYRLNVYYGHTDSRARIVHRGFNSSPCLAEWLDAYDKLRSWANREGGAAAARTKLKASMDIQHDVHRKIASTVLSLREHLVRVDAIVLEATDDWRDITPAINVTFTNPFDGGKEIPAGQPEGMAEREREQKLLVWPHLKCALVRVRETTTILQGYSEVIVDWYKTP